MAAVTTSFSHPIIVEKLFALPIVSDVYTYGKLKVSLGSLRKPR